MSISLIVVYLVFFFLLWYGMVACPGVVMFSCFKVAKLWGKIRDFFSNQVKVHFDSVSQKILKCHLKSPVFHIFKNQFDRRWCQIDVPGDECTC